MSIPPSTAARHTRGFTLIEVLVVMAVLAVLAAIAWPGYASYIARSKRAAARAVLLEAAQFMERQYALQSTYALPASGAASGTATSGSLPDWLAVAPAGAGSAAGQAALYTVSVSGPQGSGSPDGQGYRLTARPVAADPDCGDLTLEHTGERGRSAGRMTVAECWR